MKEALVRYIKEDLAFYIAAIVATLITAALYPSLPDPIAIHWNAAGEADGFAPKVWGAWLMIGAAIVTHWITVLAMAADPRRRNLESSNVMAVLRMATPIFLIALHGVMLLNWLEVHVDLLAAVMVMMGILFMVLGNLIGKVPQNYMAGVRLPWTLEDPEIWRKTNRLAARILFVSGIGMILLSFAKGTALVFGIIAFTAVTVLVPGIYAFYLYNAASRA